MLSPRKQSPSFLIRSARAGECPSASAQLNYLVSLWAAACALGLKEADPLHQLRQHPARFLRAPASRGFFVLRIATQSFSMRRRNARSIRRRYAGPCGTTAFCDNKGPKAATRAKRRSKPAPTSVLQGGNDASRQI